METKSPSIEAVSTLLSPLDCQIRKAGGPGFTCDVEAQRSANSFAVKYSFNTSEGRKSLITRNEFQVGMIDTSEVTHFVMYDGDAREYFLVTPREAGKRGRVLTLATLGKTFEEMKADVQSRWPKRIVWKFTRPEVALAELEGC